MDNLEKRIDELVEPVILTMKIAMINLAQEQLKELKNDLRKE